MKLKVRFKLLEKAHSDYIITLLLRDRGVDKHKQAEFLSPPAPQNLTLKDIGINKTAFLPAFQRLRRAYKNKEKLVIYSDYDVDGIVGATILWQSMFLLGFDVMPHIPDRKLEGYGFSKFGIEKVIKKYAPNLIVSVDHGISEEDYISYLKKRGIEVIVLDHHLQTSQPPKSAVAVIYTQAVCAGGISYFFAKELVDNWQEKNGLKQKFRFDYVVLAGIGTITDVMPLNGVSRSLAFYALKYLNRVENIGLRALLKQSGLVDKVKYNAYDIGFIIGPRINAAGRLGDPLDALRLLCTRNTKQAKDLANKLNIHNRNRQLKLETELEEAEKQLKTQKSNHIYFVYSAEFEEGIVGLIAAKLCDKYNRPVLAASIVDGFVKGSARSIKKVNITKILGKLSSFLESYGGHEKAAGFSLLKKNLPVFKDALARLGNKIIKSEALEKEVVVDIETPLSNISLSLARALEKLEPYGEGNLEPLFLSRRVKMVHSRAVGADGRHSQLMLKDKTVVTAYKAIFFNSRQTVAEVKEDDEIDIVYSLGIDNWGGERLVLKVKEVWKSEV